MTEKKQSPNPFALFTNGSTFSYQVTEELLDNHLIPELVVLPQYGPTELPGVSEIEIASKNTRSHFDQLIKSLPKRYAPKNRQGDIVSNLNSARLEYILVACWPYLLSPEISQCAERAALNIHPSYLPDYRGSDPIGAQLDNPSAHFGVSLHLLNQSFDSGDIVLQKKWTYPGIVTRNELESDCALAGVRLFVRAMETYEHGWELLEQVD
ncbi:MAG: formyltransferase family protein [Pseudomonadota bacterium]